MRVHRTQWYYYGEVCYITFRFVKMLQVFDRKLATIIIGYTKSLSERLANIMGFNFLWCQSYIWKSILKQLNRCDCVCVCICVSFIEMPHCSCLVLSPIPSSYSVHTKRQSLISCNSFSVSILGHFCYTRSFSQPIPISYISFISVSWLN